MRPFSGFRLGQKSNLGPLKKELYDSDADFFGKTNGEIRKRLTFIVK